MRLPEKAAQSFLLILNFCGHHIDKFDRINEVKRHTLTIPMMANASTTASFRGGKVSPDVATTSSAERPPVLITCRKSFPVGFKFILLALLVLLVPIVAFAFMMMVVDNRNDYSVNCHVAKVCCGHVTTPLLYQYCNSLSGYPFYDFLIIFYYRSPVSPPKYRSAQYNRPISKGGSSTPYPPRNGAKDQRWRRI
jgi:hypothetical protein